MSAKVPAPGAWETYKIGPTPRTDSDGFTFSGVTGEAWALLLSPLRTRNATIRITALSAMIKDPTGDGKAANGGGWYLVIWHRDGDELVEDLRRELGSSYTAAAELTLSDTFGVGGIELTLGDHEYYWGLLAHKRAAAGTTDRPMAEILHLGGTGGTAEVLQDGFAYHTVGATPMPTSVAVASCSVRRYLNGTLTFQSPDRLAGGCAAGSFTVNGTGASGIVLPRCTTKPFWWMVRGQTVGEAEAQTIKQYSSANSRRTMVSSSNLTRMDSVPALTFGVTDAALDAASDETDKALDLFLNVRPDAPFPHEDYFWLDHQAAQGALGTADFRVFSHAQQSGAESGQYVVGGMPEWLEFTDSGTTEVASAEWACPLALVLGDGQVAPTEGDPPALVLETTEIKRVAKALSAAGYGVCLAGVPGGLLTADDGSAGVSGGLTRWFGGLCKMRGVLLVWASFGVEDVKAIPDAAGVPAWIQKMADAAARILGDAAQPDKENMLLVMGLPPFLATPDAWDAGAIQRFNRELARLTAALGGTFVEVYPVGSLLAADNQHYSEAGATEVVSRALAALGRADVTDPEGGVWYGRAGRED